MLTTDQIESLRDNFTALADPVNAYLIADACERIAHAGQLVENAEKTAVSATVAYRVYRAETLGRHFAEIKKEIARRQKVSLKRVDELFRVAANTVYTSQARNFGGNYLAFEDNGAIQQITKAATALADADFRNLTQTMGMVDRHGVELPLRDFYKTAMDDVFRRVITGASDYNTAVREASRALAEKGVTVIGYESGVKTSLEAAVRRNMLGGLGLMVEQIGNHNHDKMGATGWEMSAHAMSAEDHEPYQGIQYTDAEWAELNGTAERPGKLKRRIGTLHCMHNAFPVIVGVTRPQYTDAQLKKFADDNAEGVTVEGRKYTMYEARQRQRELERRIRYWKKQKLAAMATGDDKLIRRTSTRLSNTRRAYAEFSEMAGLRVQRDRLFVAGKQNRKEG